MKRTIFPHISGKARVAGWAIVTMLSIIAVASVALSTGTAHAQQTGLSAWQPAESTFPSATALPLTSISNASASLVDAVRPSVVYIEAEGTKTVTQPSLPFDLFERPFDRFFRGPDMPFRQPENRGNDEMQRRFRGQGSGFIVSPDGYIVTNNHVVEDAARFTVRLLDRRVFDAELVGRDPNTDIAVLKIDAHDLPAVTFGDSDSLRIGAWVLAIGNPLGEEFSFTVTQGIVSAKGRGLRGLATQPYGIQDFIQTDAAINPGNSGGPLINARGEVIGVNAAIASPTGYYTGYGFAIPINLTQQVTEQLIANGRVVRAILGVSVSEATPEDAEYVGLDSVHGAVVQQYSGDQSPAMKAGLQPGDVIVELDGQPVKSVAQLQSNIGFRRPGDRVRVTVARHGGRQQTHTVKLEEAPGAEQTASNAGSRAVETPGMVSRLGVNVTEVTEAQLNRQGIDGSRYAGLEVLNVDPDGPARNRLQRQEIITKVDGERVRTSDDLRSVLASVAPGKIVSLTVGRLQADGSAVTRVVRLRTASGQ